MRSLLRSAARLALVASLAVLAVPATTVHAVPGNHALVNSIGPVEIPVGVGLSGDMYLTVANLDLTSPTPLVGMGGGVEHLPANRDPDVKARKTASNYSGGEGAGADVRPVPEPEVVPRIYSYTIQAGDTLWDIAQEHGVSVVTIMGANSDVSPSRLQVGMDIRIISVDGVIHRIKSGDTVSGLADEYGVELLTIIEANGLDSPELLVAGRDIIIPGARPDIVHNVTVASGGRKYSASMTGEYLWPVHGPITSHYGWRWGRMHNGIDIGAPHGRTVVATRAGRVTMSGWNGGYGYTVVINHGDGVTSLYAHASKLLVGYGQWVEAGQAIARVGSTGHSTGPHLHFELRIDGGSINPLDVLR